MMPRQHFLVCVHVVFLSKLYIAAEVAPRLHKRNTTVTEGGVEARRKSTPCQSAVALKSRYAGEKFGPALSLIFVLAAILSQQKHQRARRQATIICKKP